MLANSLIMGLITYTVSIVYNLVLRRSLETVFYLGLRFLIYTTLMTLFLQLSFYLIKNYNNRDESKQENETTEKEENDSTTEAGENMESEEFEEQDFEDSAVNNEFDNEGFSALNSEEIDYQQNNN